MSFSTQTKGYQILCSQTEQLLVIMPKWMSVCWDVRVSLRERNLKAGIKLSLHKMFPTLSVQWPHSKEEKSVITFRHTNRWWHEQRCILTSKQRGVLGAHSTLNVRWVCWHPVVLNTSILNILYFITSNSTMVILINRIIIIFFDEIIWDVLFFFSE